MAGPALARRRRSSPVVAGQRHDRKTLIVCPGLNAMKISGHSEFFALLSYLIENSVLPKQWHRPAGVFCPAQVRLLRMAARQISDRVFL